MEFATVLEEARSVVVVSADQHIEAERGSTADSALMVAGQVARRSRPSGQQPPSRRAPSFAFIVRCKSTHTAISVTEDRPPTTEAHFVAKLAPGIAHSGPAAEKSNARNEAKPSPVEKIFGKGTVPRRCRRKRRVKWSRSSGAGSSLDTFSVKAARRVGSERLKKSKTKPAAVKKNSVIMASAG